MFTEMFINITVASAEDKGDVCPSFCLFVCLLAVAFLVNILGRYTLSSENISLSRSARHPVEIFGNHSSDVIRSSFKY